MANEDGGPAFPCANDEAKQYNWIYPGMSMRDWFAGQALNGLMADTSNADPQSNITAGQWAELSYSLADAMLAERSK